MNDNSAIHITKANKILTYILWILAFIYTLMYIARFEKIVFVEAICMYVVAITVTLMSLRKNFMTIRSYILTFAFLVFIAVGDVGLARFAIGISVCICIAALYIDRNLFILSVVFVHLEIIFLQFSRHIYDTEAFIRMMVYFEIVVIILFLLTKWGSIRIEKLSEESEKRRTLLDELDKTFGELKVFKVSLDESIQTCYANTVYLKQKKFGINELINKLEESLLKIRDYKKNNIDENVLAAHIALIQEFLIAVKEQSSNIETFYNTIKDVKHLSDNLHVIDVFSKTELFLKLKD